MPKNTDNRKLIESFFFGELPEKERFDFEERFVTDAELFEEVKATEDDLIESYVRGWMVPAQRTTFEQKFLTTKKRRERVEFSRILIEKTSEINEQISDVLINEVSTDDDTIWQKIAAFLFSPKFALTAAALTVATVFGSWFLYQNVVDREIEVVKNPDPASTETPEPTPIPAPSVSTKNGEVEIDQNDPVSNTSGDSTKQIDEPPVKNPTPDRQKPKAQNTPRGPLPPKPIRQPANPVIALFPGLVRSGGTVNELKLPARAKGAGIRLNLESVDYKTFGANLTDAEGNVVFGWSGLKAVNSKINIFVPAKKLTRGDYMIKLQGKNSSGEDESVADFQFRVQE